MVRASFANSLDLFFQFADLANQLIDPPENNGRA